MTAAVDGGQPLVVILTGATGGSHNSAAHAIAEAMREQRDDLDVQTVDVLQTNGLAGRLLERLHFILCSRLPRLWGAVYRVSDRDSVAGLVRRVLWLVYSRRLENVLAGRRPSAIVSVHPLTAGMLSSLADLYGGAPQTSVVVLDPAKVHRLWISDAVDSYYVADDIVADQIQSRATPQVRSTGLPVREGFYLVGDRPEVSSGARRALGLSVAGPVLLVSGGACGIGEAFRMIEHLAKRKPEADIVILCGHNDRLVARLRKRFLASPRLHVYGWINDPAKIFHAADLYIGKAGSGTLAEAAVAQLPCAITSVLPGQEVGNVEWASRQTPCRFTPTIDDVLNELDSIEVPQLPAWRASDRPSAVIAESLTSLLGRRPEQRGITRKTRADQLTSSSSSN